MQTEVRPYRRSDRHALSLLVNEAADREAWSAWQTDDYLAGLSARDGRVWTLFMGHRLAGYALIDSFPGLDGLYGLQGRIASQVRRQGLATFLLGCILSDLKGSTVKQISHPVTSLASEAALFLLSQGFFIEHQEVRMELPDLERPPLTILPAGFYLQTFPRHLAITRFRQLYDDSFAGLPWAQPYLSDQEVSAALVDPTDLLFLMKDGQPAGFAWLRWPDIDEVQIEPFGLTTQFQGSGLGHPLLMAILDQAAQQGARRATLGVWRDNEAAIHLYKNANFQATVTTTYLANNIESEI